MTPTAKVVKLLFDQMRNVLVGFVTIDAQPLTRVIDEIVVAFDARLFGMVGMCKRHG